MTQLARTRDGRRIKRRSAARVVLDAAGEVLLAHDSDPGVAGSGWWVVPGGGVDAGETTRDAAVRELAEETGLRLSPDALGEPVALRTVVHGYSDRVLVQHETFYRVPVQRFAARPTALTQAEAGRMGDLAWFAWEALPRPVWPHRLAELRRPGSVVEWGVVEESTVPVDYEVQDGWVVLH